MMRWKQFVDEVMTSEAAKPTPLIDKVYNLAIIRIVQGEYPLILMNAWYCPKRKQLFNV